MRALLVDDTPDKLQELQLLVNKALPQWEIDTETDLDGAMHSICDKQYQLVITDLILDDTKDYEKGGVLLAQQVRDIHPGCSIAVVSDYLKGFIEEGQSSKYYELQIDYFNRSMVPKNVYREILKNYLHKVNCQFSGNSNPEHLWDMLANTKKLSYWIFFEGGENNANSTISEIALWEKKCSRAKASIYISHPQDYYYDSLKTIFKIYEFPALVFSDKSSMSEFGILHSKGISELNTVEYGLYKTMTKIHILMENNTPMVQIQSMLEGQEFWDHGIKIFKKVGFNKFIDILLKFT